MGGGRDADEGLTPEERNMLVSLSSGGGAPSGRGGEAGAAPDAARETTTGSPPPPAEVPLSDEEEHVLRQARSESQRVAREELPTMFDRGVGGGAEGEAPEAAATGVSPRSERSARSGASPVRETGPGRLLSAALDVINRPFRWMPPVWRMGLGLCGVLLLVTLLVVMLVRMLFDA